MKLILSTGPVREYCLVDDQSCHLTQKYQTLIFQLKYKDKDYEASLDDQLGLR